jgi:hypothetical protein
MPRRRRKTARRGAALEDVAAKAVVLVENEMSTGLKSKERSASSAGGGAKANEVGETWAVDGLTMSADGADAEEATPSAVAICSSAFTSVPATGLVVVAGESGVGVLASGARDSGVVSLSLPRIACLSRANTCQASLPCATRAALSSWVTQRSTRTYSAQSVSSIASM